MKHSMQISESIGLGTILALSGGFMDAYSYIERGKVFANAQTGNMLLFGVNLSEGNYQTMLNYLFPVLAFALGIALADTVRTKERKFLDSSLLYYGIIICFIIGAVIGNAVVRILHEKAILGCSFLLFVAFLIMFIDREKELRENSVS